MARWGRPENKGLEKKMKISEGEQGHNGGCLKYQKNIEKNEQRPGTKCHREKTTRHKRK